MIVWIKRLARIMGHLTFFVVFVAGIDLQDPLNISVCLIALGKAFAAAFLFWLVGYVLGDIMFKGLVESLEVGDVPVLEGGLLQRVRDGKKRTAPETSASEPRPAKGEKKER